jgi:competence protein ComEA
LNRGDCKKQNVANQLFEEQFATESNLINLNTATQAELESLTGIGASTAKKIIDYRKQNGKFKSIEEIKNVSGIGDAKYAAIKDDITV